MNRSGAPVYAQGVSYNGDTPAVNEKEKGLTDFDRDRLLQEARSAAAQAYAPYSGFRGGAALLCADGERYRGVNVENRSYGLTNCAERSAVFAAVSMGRASFAVVYAGTEESTQKTLGQLYPFDSLHDLR